MHYLTIEQRESLQAAMTARAEALRDTIAQALGQGGEGTQSLADHREDTDDDAVVDEESSMEAEALERQTMELRSIEAALLRLHTPGYGECADCGEDIPYVRLQANPLATRCTACQTKFEHTHATPGHARL
jgi:RNA polymerase-binding protein DksA